MQNLLLLTRMEQGQQAREVETVDITDLINQVIGLVQQQSKEKHIAVLLTPAEESVVVAGQEALLRQLLLNMLDNALKYTSENGKITIGLSQDTSYGIVKVTDTGVGIAPEHQARIFDRFYRIDAARSETKGYGLGLAIAQAIVALHHGKIRVHSAVGKRTDVYSLFTPGLKHRKRILMFFPPSSMYTKTIKARKEVKRTLEKTNIANRSGHYLPGARSDSLGRRKDARSIRPYTGSSCAYAVKGCARRKQPAGRILIKRHRTMAQR